MLDNRLFEHFRLALITQESDERTKCRGIYRYR